MRIMPQDGRGRGTILKDLERNSRAQHGHNNGSSLYLLGPIGATHCPAFL
jgi:hypothetical protein